MTDPVTHTVAKWRIIADRLASGQVRFSTGSQCRMAASLAEYIRIEVYRRKAATKVTIDFADNWDAVLSVHQAGW